MKQCIKCGEVKDEAKFTKAQGINKTRGVCKICYSKRNREIYKKRMTATSPECKKEATRHFQENEKEYDEYEAIIKWGFENNLQSLSVEDLKAFKSSMERDQSLMIELSAGVVD